MIKNAEETKTPNTNEGTASSSQYELRLSREDEKAAIVFRKMKHVGHYDYKNFRALWRSCWSEDFKTQRDDKLWMERYQRYLHQWSKWNIKQYNDFIKRHKEPSIPGDIQKRLSANQIVAEQVDRNKKLGGYRLKQRAPDNTGKKQWQTVAGKKYDLSLIDIVNILNKRDPGNQINYVPVEKPKAEADKSQKPEKQHERITYKEVDALLKVPDKIEYIEPAPGEVINTINRSRANSWKVRLKALSQMSRFKDERVDKRLVDKIKRDQSKYGRDVATLYANLRGLGGKEGFPFPPKYSPLSKSDLMPKIERGLTEVRKSYERKKVVPTFNEIIYEFRKRHENFYLFVEGYMYSPSNPRTTQKWFRDKCDKLKITYKTQANQTQIGA